MKRFAATLITLILVAAWPASAEEATSSGESAADTALIEGAGFAPDDVGYLVVDLDDGRVLAEHNADRTFIPASVVKIPAIAAALEILGGEHRFATTLLAEGDVKDGVLAGSLTLRGGGDPFLTNDDLQAMAQALAANGIDAVDGPFFYDATTLVEIPQINELQPEAAGYNTGVSALSVNFNRIRLNWRMSGAEPTAAATAQSEKITLPLDTIGVTFADAEPEGPIIRAGAPSEDSWLLSPELAADGEDWLPVGSPSLITANVFRGLAETEGITLPEPVPGVAPPEAREVVRHESIPLTEVARGVLRYSNNLSAELVGLTATLALTGRSLSLEESAGALAAWWRLRRSDADWTGFAPENHSGLSSTSRATPRQIVAVLVEAAGSVGGADFHGLLREINWKGVEGTARVKTGTMSYARGLAGYIDTAAGNRLAFAIFVNDLDERAALDAAFDPHVRGINPESRPWRRRALRLEEKLTTDWAERF